MPTYPRPIYHLAEPHSSRPLPLRPSLLCQARRDARWRALVRCTLALLAFCLMSASVRLDAQVQRGADDFRISHAGPDGSTLHDAAHDGVAYNSREDRYLVVWDADDRIPGLGATFNGKREVFGRILAGDGTLLGPTRLLATAGPADDERWDAENPEAVYNPNTNEFLVVWVATVATGPVAAKREIFLRRVSSGGAPLGEPVRVSQTGSDDNLQRDSREPSLALNPVQNEVLVVWQREESDQGSRVEHEVYAQRLSGHNAALVGGAIRVSTMGPSQSTAFDAFDPDVTFAEGRGEYLVVWRGDDDRLGLVEGEFEIFAQRLDAFGNEVGGDDLRISQMGPPADTAFEAEDPAVAYNRDADEWMVTWTGIDDLLDGEEIHGQRLRGDGIALGSNFRISQMGPAGDLTYRVDESLVVYNEMAGEYFVLWIGEDDRDLMIADEFEVFGQRLDSLANEVGLDDVRLSTLGPDGDPSYDPFSIGLSYNTQRGEMLVVFSGDDDRGSQVDDEVEIFGQRVEAADPTCLDGLEVVCLTEGRFQVDVQWRVGNSQGRGQADRLSADTGWFWFFDPANTELVVKVLDGRSINGKFWVFFGALSDVEYVITVTDTETGEQRQYANPRGNFASVGDTSAFPLAAGTGSSPSASTAQSANVIETLDSPMGSCVPSPTALCLNQGRFRAEVEWTVTQGTGSNGAGKARPLTADTGWFWFFDESNTELIVKVLDARAINGRYWVYFGALSDVQYTLRITDTATGVTRSYENPAGTFASVGDVEGFLAQP